MIDITHKQITLRTATAEGRVHCSSDTLELIKTDSLPKGNLLDIARAAGLLAAKNTAAVIPHCHPVSIDGLEVKYELLEGGPYGVHIQVTGKSIGRTGIEMEVLNSVSAIALTIYDLLKPVDKGLEITGIKLLKKTGGKSDRSHLVEVSKKTAILVSSDSVSKGEKKDRSGQVIKEILEKFNAGVEDLKVVPDEPEQIRNQIQAWVDSGIEYIFTTGGTGLSPRDVTTETVREMLDREAPGVAEAMRVFGTQRTPLAMLSRSLAGHIGDSVIVCLPGSSNGAKESLEAVLPGLFHSRNMLKGMGH